MHIKVDEDLPVQATQRLRAEGYDASSVVDVIGSCKSTEMPGPCLNTVRHGKDSPRPTMIVSLKGGSKYRMGESGLD